MLRTSALRLGAGLRSGGGFGLARLATSAALRPASLHAHHLPHQPRPLSTAPAAADDIDIDGVAYGFMASQALFTGIELGIFDKIAETDGAGLSLSALQAAVAQSAPRLQTLLTSLVAIKALKRDASSGAYTNSANTASFLVRNAKYYYGDYLQYQMGRQFYHRMGALPEVYTKSKDTKATHEPILPPPPHVTTPILPSFSRTCHNSHSPHISR